MIYVAELDYREVAEDTRMEEYIPDPAAEAGDMPPAPDKTLSPIQEQNFEMPPNIPPYG